MPSGLIETMGLDWIEEQTAHPPMAEFLVSKCVCASTAMCTGTQPRHAVGSINCGRLRLVQLLPAFPHLAATVASLRQQGAGLGRLDPPTPTRATTDWNVLEGVGWAENRCECPPVHGRIKKKEGEGVSRRDPLEES